MGRRQLVRQTFKADLNYCSSGSWRICVPMRQLTESEMDMINKISLSHDDRRNNTPIVFQLAGIFSAGEVRFLLCCFCCDEENSFSGLM